MKKSSFLITDSLIEKYFSVMKTISRKKNWGFDLPEMDFIKGMMFLKPQSYGTRIESYIINTLGYKKIPAEAASGDARTNNNNTVEIKVSVLTPTNDSLNLVQIRLFHSIDFYLCIAYDFRDIKNYKKYMFLLSHDEMVQETKTASAAHGTKKVNKSNKKVELRLSFKCDDTDPTFVRWCKNYQKLDYDEISKNV